jgi:predicted Zn-dependent protease
MKTRFRRLRACLILTLLIVSCSTVPLTGRRQLNLVSDSSVLSMSAQQYDEFLSSHEVIRNTKEAAMVQRVGRRIQDAVERYFAEHNMSDRLKGYSWEFNLVESKEVNAWCMPGGKVVVYTGILPIAGDEAGLAVVMAHEIAHAIAKHGNERMSQALLTQLGGTALSVALESYPEQTQAMWMAAFGAGAQVGVLLPYSRLQESEADRLGLIFMAMAGYDPNEAPRFWSRMASEKGGAAPPEFLSTHPSDKTRIEKIKEEIPEAMKYYEQARSKQ